MFTFNHESGNFWFNMTYPGEISNYCLIGTVYLKNENNIILISV